LRPRDRFAETTLHLRTQAERAARDHGRRRCSRPVIRRS
jgi:hypothetical protein